MKKIKLLALSIFSTHCIFAAEPFTTVNWKWSADPGAGTSIINAFDYFDEANWIGGVPVDSGTQKAVFTDGMTGVKYVKADRTVHVGDMYNKLTGDFSVNSTKYLVFVSDYPVVFNRPTTYAIPYPDGIMFYADVSWLSTWYPYSMVICGDLANALPEDFGSGDFQSVNRSLPLAVGRTIEIRYDLFAKNSDPVRPDAGGFGATTMNAGNLTLVAPRGSDEDVVGLWSQKEGSPYIFRTGDEHVLCAGTLVVGEGIASGTFVKRIFPDGSVELSENAQSTVENNELTFRAFSPKVAQKPFTIYSSQSGERVLRLMKWREKDVFEIPVSEMSTAKGMDGEISWKFTVKDGALPAKVVIRKADEMRGALKFDNCHVELGATAFKNATDVQIPNDSSFARLAVTNGICATIANFSKNAGTLEKTDAGTLTLDLTGGEGAYTGLMAVKEGELVLAAAAQSASISVAGLSVSNGATLRIPDCGIVCRSFSAEKGAVVAGGGTLKVTEFSDSMMNAVCIDGAKIVYSDTSGGGDIFAEPPAAGVPGNPAVWFDASRLDSFGYDTVDGVNYVTRWNDVRGESVMSATAANESKLPELNVSEDGRRNFVYFSQVSSAKTPEECHELLWAHKVSGIVSVFKVLDCAHGGGQFLGGSSLWRPTEYKSYDKALIYETATAASLLDNSRFYVNGRLREWRSGYAYVGASTGFAPSAHIPQVAELHLEGGSVSASGFSAQTDTAAGRNGNQNLYELIVYTNKLTEAERLAVTGYLMKKYLNADVEFETVSNVQSVDAVTAGQKLGVDAGSKMAAGTVSGAGVFAKTGAGELYIADCHAPEVKVAVTEGRLSVRSAQADGESLPEGAVLHLDASDPSTYLGKHETGGEVYLTEWGDARGAGYGSVKVLYPNSITVDHPRVVPGKQNALAMVDFGKFGTAVHPMMTGGVMRVSTFFTVQNSENGGGYLFGDTAVNCYSPAADGHHGLIRYPDGALSRPVVYSVYGSAAVCCFGPGATRVRLNGRDVVGTEAYYTGGCDLLTVQTYEQLIGNSISHGNCNNPVYGGGKMVGELIYYNRRLTDEETERVEAYLNKKWFGRDTAAYTPACVASADIAAGATLAVYGNGPLVVDSCSGGGTLSGSLKFAAGSSWEVTADNQGVSASLAVTGTLDISELAKVVLNGQTKPAAGSYTLVTAAGISGDISGVQIDSSSAWPRWRYRLRRTDTSLVLDVLQPSLTIIMK